MYSQTCLKWSPVGQKSLAVIERVAALKSCLVPMEFCRLELEVSKWTRAYRNEVAAMYMYIVQVATTVHWFGSQICTQLTPIVASSPVPFPD